MMSQSSNQICNSFINNLRNIIYLVICVFSFISRCLLILPHEFITRKLTVNMVSLEISIEINTGAPRKGSNQRIPYIP